MSVHLDFPLSLPTNHQFIHLFLFKLFSSPFSIFSLLIFFIFLFFIFRAIPLFLFTLYTRKKSYYIYILTPIQNGFHLFCSKTHKQKRNENKKQTKKRECNAKCGTLTLIRSPLLFNCFYMGTARASLQTKENRLASLDWLCLSVFYCFWSRQVYIDYLSVIDIHHPLFFFSPHNPLPSPPPLSVSPHYG